MISSLVVALVLPLANCDREEHGITLAGSTSVEPFAERLAEFYAKGHPGIAINVQGGGSSAGIRAVQNGVCQIGMSSRALTSAEKGLTEITVAIDGIVAIVNKSNPIHGLTTEQVRAIFSGEVKSWAEVGGNPRPIVVVTREDGSGTRASFEEKVMTGEHDVPLAFAADALVQDSNGAVREIVASDPAAIGYISFGLVDERVRALAIDGVNPTDSTISSGRYPITRRFLFLTRSECDSVAREFIRYVLSPEGQQVLRDEGLVSVR
ncbi:MAG: phosphate ABC transporter substrate-binding protein [candidate division WOR-3 bacterium]